MMPIILMVQNTDGRTDEQCTGIVQTTLVTYALYYCILFLDQFQPFFSSKPHHKKSRDYHTHNHNNDKMTRIPLQILLGLSIFLCSHGTFSSTVAFTLPTTTSTRKTTFVTRLTSSINNDNNESNKNKKNHPMSKNELSHAMIRVPNVNATIDYFINRGATLQTYNNRGENKESAFLNFQGASFNAPSKNSVNGDSSSSSSNNEDMETKEVKRFSLEIVSYNPKPDDKVQEWKTGNIIQYFGLSMLLNFDLKRAAAKLPPPPQLKMEDVDPNGVVIKSVASGPGDPFSRICLHVDPAVGLKETADFYSNILGMEQVAVGEDMVCVRYTGNVVEDEVDGKKRSVGGVSITLVFTTLPTTADEGGEKVELDHGTFFDHFAVDTSSLDVAKGILKETGKEDCVFMEPTEMFGATLMGLMDPNGYKVYLVERKEM
mmetsp:Transcript_24736/g.32805  ORF Transcript_24736/g.32805 Transcript_24736/m.32805 type:complete len:431 (+) Transcript_24736:38-1330(+)